MKLTLARQNSQTYSKNVLDFHHDAIKQFIVWDSTRMSVKDLLIWKASAVYKRLTDVFQMSVLHTF